MYDGFYWPLNHPYILINCIKFIKQQSDVLFLGDCLVFGIHWLRYRRKIDILQERIGIGSCVYKLFVFFYNPFYGYIHQKSTIKQLCWMNEWMNELMDDGNISNHSWSNQNLCLPDKVLLKYAQCLLIESCWLKQAHPITISATDYQSSF